MQQRDPPPTEEGWYALHDFRTIDWDAWRAAPERRRERAIEEGVEYLQAHEALEDADEGGSAVFTVVGHKADLMILHLRPTVADLETAERRFEQTAFAEFTEQPTSYLSVTEASGYTERAREYFDGEVADDSGLAQYIQKRLHPDVPDAEHVCFYPMSKRRESEQNWYDLSFDERAEHMARHGDIGRGYGGKVNQMIASSVGFDDWEWGVTLWADDPTDIKDLLYEMRFDPSSSQFAEFGPFYFGRRFPPTDLGALLAGERVPTDGASDEERDAVAAHAHGGDTSPPAHDSGDGHAHGDAGGESDHPHGDSGGGSHPHAGDDHSHGEADAAGDADTHGGGAHPGSAAEGDAPHEAPDPDEDEDMQQKLANLGLYPGQDYEKGTYGLVFYSTADAQELADEVDGLRGNFEHYDTHVLTTVRANEGRAAIASVWKTESAADTAAGFLNDLAGVVEGYHGPLGEGEAVESGETAGGDDGDDIRGELADLDIYAGKPHGEDVYALVLYSEADPADLFEEVAGLRENFEHYDTHVKTAVYEDVTGEGYAAVASIWETQSAADTASGFLSDLPGVVGRAEDAAGPDSESGFGTMGMFYTVEPDAREDFVEKFAEVGDLLAEMEGHHATTLLANREDENDMFIASRWRSKDDAMAFFRSDAFSDTVSWGRDVLADRPRHVFMA